MKIAEVSKQFDVTPDTLRYYEKVGLIPPVKRNESGIRDYGDIDVNWVKFVKCMRNAGLPIEVLAEYVRLFNQGEATAPARKEILLQQRNLLAAKMNDIRITIDLLDHKIADYDKILELEQDLREPRD